MTYCLSWWRAVASADAHVPRHSDHPHRDPHFDSRDALAPGGPAAGARRQRQTRTPHCLCGTLLTAGQNRARWIGPRVCRGECLWGSH